MTNPITPAPATDEEIAAFGDWYPCDCGPYHGFPCSGECMRVYGPRLNARISSDGEKLALADKVLDEAEARIRERDAQIEKLAQARKDNERLENLIVRHRDAATDERGEGAVLACTDLDDEADRITKARAALAQPGYDANGSPVE